jgi:hypothetical protein
MYLLLFVIILIIVIIFWNREVIPLGKPELFALKKYDTLFRMISSLGLFFVAYSIYTTEQNAITTNAIYRIQLFRDLSNELINEHNKQILETKSNGLLLFYSELVGLKKPNLTDKLNVKELAFSISILNHLAQTLVLINNFNELKNMRNISDVFNERSTKIISHFIKHPRFREYWFHYKSVYSGKPIRDYMARNFHL